jgi:hypothetical protein
MLVERFRDREDAIRYLALNASTEMEDLWAADDAAWLNAPARRIEFPDMVERRKEQSYYPLGCHGRLVEDVF